MCRVIEALTDPKTWLFALFAAVNNLSTSLSTQLQIIIASIDFSPMQTTLLGWMSTLLILSNVIGIEVASRIPNCIAWVGIACFVPSLLGVFLINVLPWHDKAGLLFSIWIISTHDITQRRRPILTLVISSLRHWLCVSFVLGVANDGWAHKECYNECHRVICPIRWQCHRAAHVENKI